MKPDYRAAEAARIWCIIICMLPLQRCCYHIIINAVMDDYVIHCFIIQMLQNHHFNTDISAPVQHILVTKHTGKITCFHHLGNIGQIKHCIKRFHRVWFILVMRTGPSDRCIVSYNIHFFGKHLRNILFSKIISYIAVTQKENLQFILIRGRKQYLRPLYG